MHRLRGIARWFLVTVGIVVLTSFTIDATDSLTGSNSALSLLTRSALEDACPAGTVEWIQGTQRWCIDQYENSVGQDCPVTVPSSALESRENVNDPGCQPQSVAGELPWRNVTYHQAQNLCAKRGARLPTTDEWHQIALGTSDSDVCNSDGGVAPTASYDACISGLGAYDMIGNVWEWVDASVVDGVIGDVVLPKTGYVAAADTDGLALETAAEPDPLFNNDYFWSSAPGRFAMIRGGFYGSGEDGGLYSIHADIDTNFNSPATGFRCVTEM